MIRTFKYKVKTDKQTEINANEWLELCRQLYNLALEQKRDYWNCRKQYLRYYQQGPDLVELKKEFIQFKKINAQTLGYVLIKLDQAYNTFFSNLKKKNGRAGLPRFKSKKRYNSFTLDQNGWELKNNILTIFKVGNFKLKLSRPIEGKIKTITVKRTSLGWFTNFHCEIRKTNRVCKNPTKEVGIDLGITKLLYDSDNNFVDNPKYYINSQKQLRRKQRSLTRKIKNSNNYKKQLLIVQKQFEKIKNQRNDFQHKLSTSYVDKYGKIYVEDLNILGMIQNHNLSNHISDSSWGTFINKLFYKVEETGGKLIKVDPRYTSQTCSNCGYIDKNNRLTQSEFKCLICNHTENADYNASKNILRLGQDHITKLSSIEQECYKTSGILEGVNKH